MCVYRYKISPRCTRILDQNILTFDGIVFRLSAEYFRKYLIDNECRYDRHVTTVCAGVVYATERVDRVTGEKKKNRREKTTKLIKKKKKRSFILYIIFSV